MVVRLRRRERPPALGEAGDEALERVRPAFEERLGQPAGRHGAKRIAVPAGVLGGDEALLARDPQRDRTALVEQRRGERGIELAGPQVSTQPQDVVQLVRVARLAAELRLDLLERAGIDQLAQLLLAEQLLEQVTVER